MSMFTTLIRNPIFDGFLGGVIATLVCLLLAIFIHWCCRQVRYVSDGFIRSWYREHYPFFNVPKRTCFYRLTLGDFQRLVRLSKGNPEWLFNRITYPPARSLEDAFMRKRFDGFAL